jgi:uncharacterized protein YbbK (DUF523 family)
MNDYTPGLWWATNEGVRDDDGFICLFVKPTRYEAQEERFAHETAEREADARLIAVAPEILEALEFCRAVIWQHGCFEGSEKIAVAKADAAIAKAKGEV